MHIYIEMYRIDGLYIYIAKMRRKKTLTKKGWGRAAPRKTMDKVFTEEKKKKNGDNAEIFAEVQN